MLPRKTKPKPKPKPKTKREAFSSLSLEGKHAYNDRSNAKLNDQLKKSLAKTGDEGTRQDLIYGMKEEEHSFRRVVKSLTGKKSPSKSKR